VAAPAQQAAQSSPPRRPMPARSSSPLRSHPIALTPSASAKGVSGATSRRQQQRHTCQALLHTTHACSTPLPATQSLQPAGPSEHCTCSHTH
jgi:hypothetical protein